MGTGDCRGQRTWADHPSGQGGVESSPLPPAHTGNSPAPTAHIPGREVHSECQRRHYYVINTLSHTLSYRLLEEGQPGLWGPQGACLAPAPTILQLHAQETTPLALPKGRPRHIPRKREMGTSEQGQLDNHGKVARYFQKLPSRYSPPAGGVLGFVGTETVDEASEQGVYWGRSGSGNSSRPWTASHLSAYSFYLFQPSGHKHGCEINTCIQKVVALAPWAPQEPNAAMRPWRPCPEPTSGSLRPRARRDRRPGSTVASQPRPVTEAQSPILGLSALWALLRKPQIPGTRNPPRMEVVFMNHTLTTTELRRTQAAAQNSLTLPPNARLPTPASAAYGWRPQ